MDIRKLSLLVFFLGLLLGSCNPTPTPTFAPRSAWITKLFDDPACPLPCWENVTPGEMTMDEAYAILAQNPTLYITEYWTEPIGRSQQKSISWKFIQSNDSGIAFSDREGVMLKFIRLHLDNDQLLTVADIISVYGFTTKVYLSSCREGLCIVDLVYIELGLSPSTEPLRAKYNNEQGFQVNISEETRLSRIYLHPLGEQYLREDLGGWADYDGIPNWNGFGKYSQIVPAQ